MSKRNRNQSHSTAPAETSNDVEATEDGLANEAMSDDLEPESTLDATDGTKSPLVSAVADADPIAESHSTALAETSNKRDNVSSRRFRVWAHGALHHDGKTYAANTITAFTADERELLGLQAVLVED